MCKKPCGFQDLFHLLRAPGMVLRIFQPQLHQTDTTCPAQMPSFQFLSSTLCSCPLVPAFCAAKGSIVCQRTVLGHISCFISKASAWEYSHPLTVSQWLTDVRLHKPASLPGKSEQTLLCDLCSRAPHRFTLRRITPLIGFFLFHVLSPPPSPNS